MELSEHSFNINTTVSIKGIPNNRYFVVGVDWDKNMLNIDTGATILTIKGKNVEEIFQKESK